MNTRNGLSHTDPHWAAPFTDDRQVSGSVAIPGSKSLTNRYLVLAALASEASMVRKPLYSRDSQLMIAALQQLGAVIEPSGAPGPFGADLSITPIPEGPAADTRRPELRHIDCGLAGTVMRFVPPVAALLSTDTTFDGDPHARVRPMGPVIQGLRDLGVTVQDEGRGTLPLTVSGAGSVRGGTVRIDASGSSQFVSALMLAAVRFDGPLVLKHDSDGAGVPSLPHVAMTVEVLREAGVNATRISDTAWWVEPARMPGLDVTVEPDLSNAGPFLAAAMVTGGTVSIPDWPSHTTQGGDHWRSILPQFGGTVDLTGGVLTATGPAQLNGVDLDLSEAGELAPTVAAMCALATGPSQLRGIAHLRGHETDRLAALRTEINLLGGNVVETADGLIINPAPLHGGLFHSYDDHRMATAGAIIGLRVADVSVENIGTTAKTLPDFSRMWTTLVNHGA